MKQDNIICKGTVTQELGNSMFSVSLEGLEESPEILCTISGKIRKNYIRIMAGDKVEIEMSPYDLTRGRIKTRLSIQPSTTNPGGVYKHNINNKKRKQT